MRSAVWLMGALVVWAALTGRAAGGSGSRSGSGGGGGRYAFFRSLGGGSGAAGAGGTRRVFGGSAVALSEFPAACALLDRYWAPRCSASVVAPRWALTAAHCVAPHVAYVRYNARRPAGHDGRLATVHYLYRHPGYQVVQEDEGRGMDVTLLHHDVGLVRTREAMALSAPPPPEPLRALRQYDLLLLQDEDVQVLGFGRTEQSVLGEELFAVRLRLVGCERGAWLHCACGVALPGAAARGVCSGDSGGPVLYRGAQVGVTSMGPLECASAQAQTPGAATSVFTALHRYADVINATIYDTEAALRMRMISRAPRVAPLLAPLLALLAAG